MGVSKPWLIAGNGSEPNPSSSSPATSYSPAQNQTSTPGQVSVREFTASMTLREADAADEDPFSAAPRETRFPAPAEAKTVRLEPGGLPRRDKSIAKLSAEQVTVSALCLDSGVNVSFSVPGQVGDLFLAVTSRTPRRR